MLLSNVMKHEGYVNNCGYVFLIFKLLQIQLHHPTFRIRKLTHNHYWAVSIFRGVGDQWLVGDHNMVSESETIKCFNPIFFA